MRTPFVPFSEIFRQTLIAAVALLCCGCSLAMTVRYFGQISPGTATWLFAALGAVLEMAKVGFGLTGARYWGDARWFKSVLFWAISIALSTVSIIAGHGVLSESERLGVSQRVMASTEYRGLEADAEALEKRIGLLVQSIEEDLVQQRRTRALRTEEHLDAVRGEYLEAKKKLAELQPPIHGFDDASGPITAWREAWCLAVALLFEVIGQLAMLEVMASAPATPSVRQKNSCWCFTQTTPSAKAPELRVVPSRKKASLYDEAERLVRGGLPATHANLMAALHCSRSTSQRALRRMRTKGVVELRNNRNLLAA